MRLATVLWTSQKLFLGEFLSLEMTVVLRCGSTRGGCMGHLRHGDVVLEGRVPEAGHPRHRIVVRVVRRGPRAGKERKKQQKRMRLFSAECDCEVPSPNPPMPPPMTHSQTPWGSSNALRVIHGEVTGEMSMKISFPQHQGEGLRSVQFLSGVVFVCIGGSARGGLVPVLLPSPPLCPLRAVRAWP